MNKHDEYDVAEPSRRRLLKGVGALGGAFALAGGCPVAHAAKPQSAPGTLSPDARMETQPFYGEHQAGILTPQQASMMLVAFDSLASDKADLERLFRLLTTRIAFLRAVRHRKHRIRACRRWIPGSSGRLSLPII